MKKILFQLCLAVMPVQLFAQQIAAANDIRLVSTAGIKLVLEGGISFTGTSLFTDHGETYLNPNPAPGSEDWNDQTPAGIFEPSGTGHVYFVSDIQQNITGGGKFYNLTLNNLQGILLNNPVEVRNQLNLEKGYLYTGADYIFVSNPALNSVASGVSFLNTWINGRLRRRINGPGQYLFPIGKFLSPNQLYAPIRIENKTTTTPADYTAEYFTGIPFDPANVMSPPIDHISRREFWHITSNIPSGIDDDAQLSLSWRTYSDVSPIAATRDSLIVAHYLDRPPFIWEAEFNSSVANIVNGADENFGWVTTNKAVGSFTDPERRFTLATRSPFNMLPISLLDWNALLVNHEVRTSWTVSNDINTLRYEVERSTNARDFDLLKILGSLKQAGKTAYGAIDHLPVKGWNYYRLKIIDDQGKAAFSAVKKIFIKDEIAWTLYPNPAQDILTIQTRNNTATQKLLEIFDANGKIMLKKITWLPLTSLNVSKLAGGWYSLRLTGGNISGTKVFIKK